MSDQSATGLCPNCKKRVLVQRKGTNHVLHLLLTIVTLGWWLIVWILASVKIGGWRCSQCGTKVARRLFE